MQAHRAEASGSPENGKAPADVDEAGAGGAGGSSKTVAKSGHGKGKGGAKRHRKMVKPAIEGMSNNEIRRLARRAGVKRIGGGVYESVRKMTQNFLDDVLFKTLIHVEHRQAKTVTPHDVVAGFKCMGGTVYGFGN
jgi:histone H4